MRQRITGQLKALGVVRPSLCLLVQVERLRRLAEVKKLKKWDATDLYDCVTGTLDALKQHVVAVEKRVRLARGDESEEDQAARLAATTKLKKWDDTDLYNCVTGTLSALEQYVVVVEKRVRLAKGDESMEDQAARLRATMKLKKWDANDEYNCVSGTLTSLEQHVTSVEQRVRLAAGKESVKNQAARLRATIKLKYLDPKDTFDCVKCKLRRLREYVVSVEKRLLLAAGNESPKDQAARSKATTKLRNLDPKSTYDCVTCSLVQLQKYVAKRKRTNEQVTKEKRKRSKKKEGSSEGEKETKKKKTGKGGNRKRKRSEKKEGRSEGEKEAKKKKTGKGGRAKKKKGGKGGTRK